jgi:hypothetical protein
MYFLVNINKYVYILLIYKYEITMSAQSCGIRFTNLEQRVFYTIEDLK